MKRHLALLAAFPIILAGCQNQTKPSTAAAEPAPVVQEPLAQSAAPLTVRENMEVNVTAKVKAINHASRWITLEDESNGHAVSFVVDKSVQRLHEVRIGDNVKARYKATLLAQLRPPTAEEAADPVAYLDVSGRTMHGTTPAAGAAQGVRLVTTVEAVDAPNMRVTLRGPMGDVAVVQGNNPENFKRMSVGDTIVISFAESMVIALEKVATRL